jgi:drug/metabolite transporter (DMT)-like permease
MLVYFRLIQTAGPGFTSQLNYLIPLWAVAIGILFLGEALGLGHLIGLLLILGGVLIARRRAPAAPRARAAQGSAQRADQPAGPEQGSRSV